MKFNHPTTKSYDFYFGSYWFLFCQLLFPSMKSLMKLFLYDDPCILHQHFPNEKSTLLVFVQNILSSSWLIFYINILMRAQKSRKISRKRARYENRQHNRSHKQKHSAILWLYSCSLRLLSDHFTWTCHVYKKRFLAQLHLFSILNSIYCETQFELQLCTWERHDSANLRSSLCWCVHDYRFFSSSSAPYPNKPRVSCSPDYIRSFSLASL